MTKNAAQFCEFALTGKILLTGANGQLGSELVQALADRYGADQVIASDIHPAQKQNLVAHEILDVMDGASLERLIQKHHIEQIYHLAAALSAHAEKNPKNSWVLNVDGLLTVLEVAQRNKVNKIFWPSSIGAFGTSTPPHNTPQQTIMEPATVYGISKLAGEGWCRWYRLHKNLDVRSLRYPGLISYRTPPGGGTTDYAIEIFHHALAGIRYICPLAADTALPMMYMPDAVRATIMLMEADKKQISIDGSYNLTAISFTPAQLSAQIRVHRPDFTIIYQPDYRQAIADSWPCSIDDTVARQDWGWQAEFGLAEMVNDMIENLHRWA